MSSSLRHPSFSHPPHTFDNKDDENEETKEDEHSLENSNTAHARTNFLSRVIPLELYYSDDLQSQTQHTRIFISFLRRTITESSLQTQMCLSLLSFGSVLILLSLPTGIIIGAILFTIGITGICIIATQQYIKFAQQRGLISLFRDGVIKDFILKGSITDIFYEIRNSNLGIPDFLLSQILPIDETDREIIFERLPAITRNVVSREGLIYLTPQLFQDMVLPLDLQDPLSDISNVELSPLPPPSPRFSSHRYPTRRYPTELSNQVALEQPDEDTDDVVKHAKNEIEHLGMKWLWQKNQDQEEEEDKMNARHKTNHKTYVLQSNITKNGTDVFESNDDLSSSNDDEDTDEKRDIHDEQYHVSFSQGIGKEPMETKQFADDDDVAEEEKTRTDSLGIFGHMTKLFTDTMYGGNADGSKPMLKAVIDTRMKEFGLQMISSLWKSPFSGITDAQLLVIFMCCVGCVSYYLTKNKKVRNKFVKSIKYMGFMALVWIAILSFIELNIRKRSKVFKKIWRYINNRLFHSQHKKARDRKRSQSDVGSRSMRMYSELSMSRRNLLQGIATTRGQIRYRDKKSRYSRTMPFMKDVEPSPATSPRSEDSFSLSDYSTPQTPMTPSTPMVERGKFRQSLKGIPDDSARGMIESARSVSYTE